MKDFRSRKKQKKNILHNPLFIIILILIIIILGKSTYSSYKKKEKAKQEKIKFENKYTELLHRKAMLSKKNNLLKTIEGKKEQLKKVYDIGEKGEVIIHVSK